MFSSNKWHKKEGSPSSFWRKRQLISLNSSVFIENLPSFKRACTRARANHAKIDAQKGCAMQLNGITLILMLHLWSFPLKCILYPVGGGGGAILKLLLTNENISKVNARQSKLAMNTP